MRDRYRVFILDEVHLLSKDAFDALLKILEEPPAHVVFIFATTETDKFPATILSRCLQVDFRPIPADLVAARLLDVAGAEGFVVSAAASQMLARAGEGSLRDALSLLDRVHAFCGGDVDEDAVAAILGLPPFDVVLALWHALAAGQVAEALAVVEREQHAGRDPVALYEQMVQLLHALLAALLPCRRPQHPPCRAGGKPARRGEAAWNDYCCCGCSGWPWSSATCSRAPTTRQSPRRWWWAVWRRGPAWSGSRRS